jgi:hypothetical protein
MGGSQRHIEVAFTLPTAAQQQLRQQAALLPPQGKGAALLLEFTGGYVSLSQPGALAECEAHLVYPDADATAKAKKAFDGINALAQLSVVAPLEQQAKTSPKPAEALKGVAAVKAMLEGLSSEQSGKELRVKAKVDTKALVPLIPDVPPPRFGPPTGPPGAPGVPAFPAPMFPGG